jgi:D-glycero-alpha-D-manno-heptose-7-phosphate kinase
VHRRVIDDLLTSGHGIDGGRAILSHLADLARAAAAALRAGDLTGWGGILAANTDAQAALNAHLVGPGHHHAIDLARRHGALGWKVNGAGGSGGSLTALAPDPLAAARLADAWRSQDPTWVVPTLRIAPGHQRPGHTTRR